jgi:putative membrane protein insertion efficiency factor
VRGVALFLVLAALIWNAQPIALGGIHVYQRALSPMAARIGLECRFTPTCSRYAEIVIARDGIVRGSWRAVKRVARCGPWTAPGTRDEP